MTKSSTLLRFQQVLCLLAIVFSLLLTGCQSANENISEGTVPQEPLTLREGDTVHIEFPGAGSLNRTEIIKRDGKISLLKGEIVAAGKTIPELQKDVLEAYQDELVTKLVVVSLAASQFPIYVTGAAGHAGRLTVDRPMTVLEAVMEAGVDVTRANLKAVRLTRIVGGKTKVFILNLDRQLRKSGNNETPFYVKPSDIIYVPEKFQWF